MSNEWTSKMVTTTLITVVAFFGMVFGLVNANQHRHQQVTLRQVRMVDHCIALGNSPFSCWTAVYGPEHVTYPVDRAGKP